MLNCFKNLGWKTITGGVLLGLGYALDGFGLPEVGSALKALGSALGVYGGRVAIAKTQQAAQAMQAEAAEQVKQISSTVKGDVENALLQFKAISQSGDR